jgi:hypothetical protein
MILFIHQDHNLYIPLKLFIHNHKHSDCIYAQKTQNQGQVALISLQKNKSIN